MLDCRLFGLNAGAHPPGERLHPHPERRPAFPDSQPNDEGPLAKRFRGRPLRPPPLHVESVAWASERKDVLSTLFWMLTMGAYAFYAEKPGTKRYLLTLGLYALGLMAKPMLVTLPFVLLLLDYWPLRRFTLPAETGKKPAALSAGVSKKQKDRSRKARHEKTLKPEKSAGEHPLLPALRQLLWERHLSSSYPPFHAS